MPKKHRTKTRGKNTINAYSDGVLGEIDRPEQAGSMIVLLSDEVVDSFGGADQMLETLESLLKKLRQEPSQRVQ